MPTIHQPPDKTTDRPLPPPDVTPYFRALAAIDPDWAVINAARAELGRPLAAPAGT